MPEMDAWTISNNDVLAPQDGRVQELALNIGAPGDRRDAHGRMWLEYPPVAGDAPNFGLQFTGQPKFFQDHPTSIAHTLAGTKAGANASIAWVAASGVEGLTGLRLSVQALPEKSDSDQPSDAAQPDTKPQNGVPSIADAAADTPPNNAPNNSPSKSPSKVAYRLKLHFGLPREAANEQRRFDVVVMGQTVLEDVSLGGDQGATAVHTIDRVVLDQWLDISFRPKVGQPLLSGLELTRLDSEQD
jgi:hypothetical protein